MILDMFCRHLNDTLGVAWDRASITAFHFHFFHLVYSRNLHATFPHYDPSMVTVEEGQALVAVIVAAALT